MTTSEHSTIPPLLVIRTKQLPDGRFRTDWCTESRRGFVLTRPPVCQHRRAVAELLALHTVTGLIRPLRFRGFQNRAPIHLSAPEIPAILCGSMNYAYLKPYVRFISLALCDLPLEVKHLEDTSSTVATEHVEACELIRNDPWDDAVQLPNSSRAAPTKLALDQIRAHLRTQRQWKAWASLYMFSQKMIRLPCQADMNDGAVDQFICPKFGWIFVVKNGRIVTVRGARSGEHRRIVEFLVAHQPALSEKELACAALFSLQEASGHSERRCILYEFLSALPDELRQIQSRRNTPDSARAIALVLKAALEPVADPAIRASILRIFLQGISVEASCLQLPDGTKALITGHVLDRLMTRFNVRSPLACMRWLHESGSKLKVVKLPALIQVAREIHYLTTSIHWCSANGWRLVVTEGVVVTAYYPGLQIEKRIQQGKR